jgi:hypothetical protein
MKAGEVGVYMSVANASQVFAEIAVRSIRS